jgi:hypothetical protein
MRGSIDFPPGLFQVIVEVLDLCRFWVIDQGCRMIGRKNPQVSFAKAKLAKYPPPIKKGFPTAFWQERP